VVTVCSELNRRRHRNYSGGGHVRTQRAYHATMRDLGLHSHRSRADLAQISHRSRTDLGLHSGLAASSVCRGPCGWCVCLWCSDTGLPLIAPDCHASWQSVVQRHGSAVDARLDYGLTGPGPHSPFTHPVWEAPGQDLLGLLGLSAVAVERGSCLSAVAVGNVGAVCRLWLWGTWELCVGCGCGERGSCVSCAACGVCRAVCGVGRRAVQPQLRGGEG
jgi:hypothetical protein